MNPVLPRILLADDDTDDCGFFRLALDELSFAVELITMSDGEKLMKFLKGENIAIPNMLFLDLNMPRKNGFECLKEIKSDKKFSNLPVIVFSTSFDQETVDLLYQHGAHYFIRKPSRFMQYKKTIQQLVLILSDAECPRPVAKDFVFTIPDSLPV